MCAWYQGLNYKQLFGYGEVPPSKKNKKLIDTCKLINASDHVERQYLFGEDMTLGVPHVSLTSVTCIL